MNQQDFVEVIIQQIEDRNKRYSKFSELINSHSILYENNKQLKKLTSKYKNEIEKLTQDNQDLSSRAHSGNSSSDRSEQTAALEQKLFRVQEELTELHRAKGSRAQQIIDLNVALQEKERELLTANQLLETKSDEINVLKEQSSNLEQRINDLQQATQTVKDEYQALHITYEAVEDKLRIAQLENRELIERWMQQKHVQAEALNTENDKVKRNVTEKPSSPTHDAAMSSTSTSRKNSTTQVANSPDSPPTAATSFKQKFTDFFKSGFERSRSGDEEIIHATYSGIHCSGIVRLPQEVVCKWKAHESEVTATRFSYSGGLLATGGSDRLIHIWNFFGDKSRLQYTLRGCNGGVTGIDFDPQEQILAASSNDYATRIWTINTQRLKLTLTGHGGKVLSARFLGSSIRLASGSSDRTVKVWDIRSGACIRSFMAGSSCNDIVAADAADCLASGHFDRKIRVWDARVSGQPQNEIDVGGRVTSLDMPADKRSLICCTKYHTLELIDLRKSAVLKVFSDDAFKVATDQTRCAFSTCGEYVCAGSSDGSVLSWNVKSGLIESIVRGHTDPVISCNWNGGRLVTGDKNKHCILWTQS